MSKQTCQSSMRVMIAVDGSDHALAALQLVHDLPLSSVEFPESLVSIVSVMPPRYGSDYGRRQAILDRAVGMLQDKGVGVTADLLVGSPSEMLLGFAANLRPGLIVLGAKGLRATLGILLGGVAQQVLTYADAPVLIVRAPYTGLRRVLLAVDGSPSSQCAAEHLASFPLPAGCEVEILHALPPLFPLNFGDTWESAWPGELTVVDAGADDEERLAEEAVGRQLLAKAAALFEAQGRKVSTALTRGDAATEIIRRVQENRVDLLVCGSRGLSLVRGWMMGSVSHKLVHYAGCSVLVVKG